MREMHLFAGAGGGILGGILLGHVCVCAIELSEYRRSVLLQRQADGLLPEFPVFDDIRTFNGTGWRGRVDVVSGGFPCQDISLAGNGAGIKGKRSGLWKEMERVVREVQPAYVFVENSPALTHRGLGVVLRDLAAMGFNAAWGVFSAADAGARHERERIWILAHSDKNECHEFQPGQGPGAQGKNHASDWEIFRNEPADCGVDSGWTKKRQAWEPEPRVGRVADGLDRLEALGDGQVPRVAALAFCTLYSVLMEENQ